MNGGTRAGAGRPKGALAKKSQATVMAAQAGGSMPREVLLEAMRYHHNLALEAPAAERGPHYDAAADMATRAAPYVHPRLLASTVTVRRVSEMTDEELAIAIADVRAEIAAAKAAAKEGERWLEPP
jgi:hypothetical protein